LTQENEKLGRPRNDKLNAKIKIVASQVETIEGDK
jgi:hypothetical protein